MSGLFDLALAATAYEGGVIAWGIWRRAAAFGLQQTPCYLGIAERVQTATKRFLTVGKRRAPEARVRGSWAGLAVKLDHRDA